MQQQLNLNVWYKNINILINDKIKIWKLEEKKKHDINAHKTVLLVNV